MTKTARISKKAAQFSVLKSADVDCNMHLPASSTVLALVPGQGVVDCSRFKKPVTIVLPAGSFTKGKYTYAPTMGGKTRWFANKDVELTEVGSLIQVTTEHKLLKHRGLLPAA